MGYYTTFTIEVTPSPALASIAKYLPEDFVLEDDQYTAELKWYDSHEDMLVVSKKCPDLIFTVYGDGEESDDHWKTVYCNGSYSSVIAELTYPEIDIQSIGNIGTRHPEYFI